jgi:hypothetical protein
VLSFKKKLTLREIHKLYLLLKDCLPEKEEEFLIHEVVVILEKITPEQFQNALLIMYNGKFDFKRNPSELALMFTRGLKETNLFSYIHFIKSMNG